MDSTLCSLHMCHLVHRWRRRNLPAKQDLDWHTKMLFVRHCSEAGISPLEAAIYVGALTQELDTFAGRRQRARKRQRESSGEITQTKKWAR